LRGSFSLEKGSKQVFAKRKNRKVWVRKGINSGGAVIENGKDANKCQPWHGERQETIVVSCRIGADLKGSLLGMGEGNKEGKNREDKWTKELRNLIENKLTDRSFRGKLKGNRWEEINQHP